MASSTESFRNDPSRPSGSYGAELFEGSRQPFLRQQKPAWVGGTYFQSSAGRLRAEQGAQTAWAAQRFRMGTMAGRGPRRPSPGSQVPGL